MSKKFLLILSEDEHNALREYQIDRAAKDRSKTILNKLIVELIMEASDEMAQSKQPVADASE